MKRLLLVIAAVVILLPSCRKINDAIDGLDSRLDKLEQESIPSIDKQISAINTSLASLDAMDKELKGYIDALTATANNLQEQINTTNTKIDEVEKALKNEISTAKTEVLSQLATAKAELEAELAKINNTIATLQEKDKELDNKITELRSYVDNELTSTENWVNATFATLEQYNALVSEIATIKEQIKAINQSITELETRLNTKIATDIATAVSNLNADIQQKVKDITDAYTSAIKSAKEEITAAYTTAIQNAITALDSSLKTWVGEQLAGYYTIAEIDAKITALQNSIKDGDDALLAQLNLLKESLQTMKTEITEAYKQAIADAINTNNGVIDTKIANEIATVNQRIASEVATINAKIATIEARLDNVEAQIKDLLTRIQSVSYIPTYEDGKATVKYAEGVSQVTLDFEISPKDAVAELAKVWDSAINLKALDTQTRAVEFIDMPIVKFEADYENGVISVTASGENLSSEFFAGTQTASARLAISDGNNSVTSEYVPMVVKEVKFSELIMPLNEIWYISTAKVIPTKTAEELFVSMIVSNKWDPNIGRGIMRFNTPITKVGEAAFQGNEALISIIIPNGVATIQVSAFDKCTNLASITIPNSVVTIAGNTFTECPSLKRVDIYDMSAWCNISFVGNATASPLRGADLYLNGEKVTNLTIPADIREIKFGAFYGCTSLTNVTIPNNVTSIRKSAFCKCNSLLSITIGDNITSIEDYAFYECKNLKEINVNSLSAWCRISFGDDFANPIRYGKLYIDSSSVSKITIPADITEIKQQAFCPYKSLTEVTIPDHVTSVGTSAFASCTGLSSLTIGGGVTSIKSYAFYNCNNLTSVTIPDSVTELGAGAFYGCTYLTSFYGKFASTDHRCLMVNGVLNSFAPAGLTHYNILEGVTSIGDYAFRTCSKLIGITIPDSVTSIGDAAFWGCSSLTSITIPNNVAYIGNHAFYECNSLKEIYCQSAIPPTGSNRMLHCYNNGVYEPLDCTIYVPRNSVSAYKSAEYWSEYADYIVGYDF